MAEPVYMAEGSKHAAKLDHEPQEFVLQLLAEGYKPKEVRVKLKQEYGIELSDEGIYYYNREKKERILEKRRALINELDRLASSSKFIRLTELEEQRDRIEASTDMDDKAKERLILDILEQQRKEMEGFKGILGMDPDNPFTAVNANLGDIEKALKALKAKETVKKAEKETE